MVMTELIKITKNGNQEVVSAKELYEFLGLSNSQWSRWYNSNIIKDDFFTENFDYQTLDIMSNGNPTKDFAITIQMAKELSMLARTEKGKQARKYFIECERKLKSIQPQQLSRKDLAYMVIAAEEKAERLQLEIDTKHKPRSQFIDKVFKSDDLITMSMVAKTLELGFGRNTLFKQLREKGILFKNTNEPKQYYVQQGYFKIKEKLFVTDDGRQKINVQTFVTQKGLGYIAKLFNVVQVPKTPIQISA